MPAKPPKGTDHHPRKRWFATHRVTADGHWQAFYPKLGEWVPVTYEQVPDQLWGMNFRSGGFKFYTDRTRECDERGFPVKKT